MHRSAVCFVNVAMVTNAIRLELEGFTAEVAVRSGFKFGLIFVRRAQWFWLIENVPYPPFPLVDCFEKSLHAIFTSIHHGVFGVSVVCVHDLVSIPTWHMQLIVISV